MTAADRRAAVAQARSTAGLTERRACRFLGFARSSQRYASRRPDAGPLRLRLRTLAMEHPRWGYRKLHRLLRREGFRDNRKRLYRLYRQEGLLVRRRRRKRVSVPRQPLPAPVRWNELWSMDFLSDALTSGRRYRVLSVVDCFSRECLGLEVDTSLPALRVIRLLNELALERGLPSRIRVDNGPEFVSNALDQWAYERGVKLEFIQPGRPVQNAWIESFNGRLRDECLNTHWFQTVAEARAEIAAFRIEYNEVRPHGALGELTPCEYVAQLTAQVAG